MSVLSGQLFKILYIILSKGIPLLVEMILKDKNIVEFLSANKTLLAMLFIVITLSLALLHVRHELHVIKTTLPILQREHKLPGPGSVENKAVTDPPSPPDKPKKKDVPVTLPRDETRDLIKKRLEEIQ